MGNHSLFGEQRHCAIRNRRGHSKPCPELHNQIEMLKEKLAKYHNQHRCGCGHPECNRCANDERIDELLEQSEQAV